ncbi:MAG: PIN domain-containing protein [Planctomycetota bacterium]|nr:PIN domain-containing protein [Planctomycetota bacterium]
MRKVFLDSNLIVYANDDRDPAKQTIAIDRIAQAIRTSSGVISTQVLAEYAAVALDKLHQPAEIILRQLLLLESLEVVQITPPLIRRSVELHSLYQVHFWDAGILAAAELANCSVLLSEDFGAGRSYGTVRVENPFVP